MIAKRKAILRYKILVNIVLITFIMLLQTTLVDFIKIKNVRPNLILVYIICASILEGSTGGGVIGLYAGLTQDVLSGKCLGFYALLGMYTGVIAGTANRRLQKENVLVALFYNFILTIIYEFAVYFFSNLGHQIINFRYIFKNILLVEALYNGGLSLIMHYLIAKISKKFEFE